MSLAISNESEMRLPPRTHKPVVYEVRSRPSDVRVLIWAEDMFSVSRTTPDNELSKTLRLGHVAPAPIARDDSLVISLSGELRNRYQQFAAEHGIEDPSAAIDFLLTEYNRLSDLAWDEALARTPDHHTALDDLIEQVQADADAGKTEELTPDLFDR